MRPPKLSNSFIAFFIFESFRRGRKNQSSKNCQTYWIFYQILPHENVERPKCAQIWVFLRPAPAPIFLRPSGAKMRKMGAKCADVGHTDQFMPLKKDCSCKYKTYIMVPIFHVHTWNILISSTNKIPLKVGASVLCAEIKRMLSRQIMETLDDIFHIFFTQSVSKNSPKKASIAAPSYLCSPSQWLQATETSCWFPQVNFESEVLLWQ